MIKNIFKKVATVSTLCLVVLSTANAAESADELNKVLYLKANVAPSIMQYFEADAVNGDSPVSLKFDKILGKFSGGIGISVGQLRGEVDGDFMLSTNAKKDQIFNTNMTVQSISACSYSNRLWLYSKTIC